MTIVNLPSASAQDVASTGYDSPDNSYWPTRYGWVARLARNAKAEWGTVTDVYAKNGAMIKHFPGVVGRSSRRRSTASPPPSLTWSSSVERWSTST
ncbi:hypothetical protein FHU38_002868 [Saccharomonospora amisosensis]|uniref:Uncharacterized protein n=1 Tax=Saccharomonospora amisosensis TaxID=1128677 RepID=A0A7X5URQ3_9PSEU|nr:hypothetical protein [Saccharomonospora amisosensis]NIJ12524.1 hypothetical protein [Saccharomonospora amisosensis]